MSRRVVIIGGGYGGLATAALFAKHGDTVTVLEKNHQLGGRAGQKIQDGFRFDTGPSWYLMPEVFETFYSLFNRDVQKELSLKRLNPGYKVYFESNDPVVIKGNLNDDARTFDGIESGAGTTLKQYVKTSQKIYDLSVKNVLYNTYKNPSWISQKEVLSALPLFAKMATTPLHQYVSRQFHDDRLTRILEYQSVFLGTSPFKAPAIYSLMSTLDFNSGVYFPKNGIYSLVESLVKLGQSFDVRYRADVTVSSIIVKNGAATGVQLENGDVIEADIVISNADLHHTETKLVPEPYQTFPEQYWSKKEPGPSALLVSLGIKGSLPSLEHHNLYFVDDWKRNFSSIYETKELPDNASLYICNPSKTDPTAAPKGHENIFMLLPLPSGKKLTAAQTERLTNLCIERLAAITESPDLKDRIVTSDIATPQLFGENFNAWQYNALGGQSHILKQSAFFRTPNQSKKVRNLYYVGAGTNPGIGLPMCLMSAQLVYKLAHDIRTNGPLTAKDLR